MLYNLLFWIIIGGIAGWLASKFMGSRHSLIMNIVIGVIGSFIGGFLFTALNLIEDDSNANTLVSLIFSFVGSVILLYVLRLLKR